MTEASQQRSVLITGVGKRGNLAHALLHTFTERGDTVYAVGRTMPAVEALAGGGATARGGSCERMPLGRAGSRTLQCWPRWAMHT